MATIRVEIDIDASAEVLWNDLCDIESHVQWMADAESITFSSEQTQGIGTSYTCLTKVGPITLNDQMVITEWEPNKAMGVAHTGIVTGSGAFYLLSAGKDTSATRFVWEEELKFPWFMGGPIGAAVGSRLVMKPIWRRNLRRLKQHIESLPAS